jgi:hypothetical protein
MTGINYHAPWHPLKHTVVGRTYPREFYQPIKNANIRESLQRIAEETEEDYLNIVNTLKQFGVTVSRPNIDPAITIMDFIDEQGHITYQQANSCTLIPRPPMQPRDSFLILGNTVLSTNSEFAHFQSLVGNHSVITAPDQMRFDAPLATVVGDTVILDCRDHPNLDQYFQNLFPDYRIKPVYIGGHNDAVFCLPKPGLIVSTHHEKNYKQTFPGWQVMFLENQSWDAIPKWRRFKHSNSEKWWAPETLANPEFADFVNQWLTNWTGYVAETVFDVNMLQINERFILVNNYNKLLFAQFKQQGIEPVIAPFRHRFFWDGGIHCITNDLYREGTRENYVQ